MVIKFNEEQLKIIKKLGLNYDLIQDLSDDECAELEEKVGDYYTLHCLDENYEPNEEGRICESILDLLSEL
ncbi:hypothetical protein ODU73_000417 [Thermoclostridium stercorarium]|uniref:hypothetical protein n=1 Tax=Thermoclostridium stercorarium TaxID=1510 RepID=UPI0002C5AFA6|nr:hypothetical protein [Thermoclostridium stercorarium]AGI38489.1 hypothetical protein Clst_0388 [Thermoclostridium stercorarium subsp. stercorarium DSM 8532]UZQ86023.1 hypothetical protein ODU73_000417 [Thermoclostridium stercorarium]